MKNALYLVVATCLTIVGCSQPSEPTQPTPPETNLQDPPPVEEVQVDVKSWDGVQELVSGAAGKVVVVDLWSTWCVPCQKEFPGLVKLHRDFGDRVACVSVNLDYIGLADEPPESSRDKVLEFLNEQQATFKNIISSDADEDVLRRLGLGSVPIVLVYGPDGQLAKAFHNDDSEYGGEGFTYEGHVAPFVAAMLAGDTGS